MQRIAPPDLLLPHRRSLGAGAEAADPGAGAALGGAKAGPKDLTGDRLPALVRCSYEWFDLDIELHL